MRQNKKTLFIAIITAMASLSLVKCASIFSSYHENRSAIDVVDDSWSDMDAKFSGEEMIRSMLSKPWLAGFMVENKNKKPLLLVGDFTNQTDDNIDIKILFESVRKELIKSGKVEFIDGEIREKLLKERHSKKTADFFLIGGVTNVISQQNDKKRVTYQIEMRLTSISTAEIIWIEIKNLTNHSYPSKNKLAD